MEIAADFLQRVEQLQSVLSLENETLRLETSETRDNDFLWCIKKRLEGSHDVTKLKNK